MWLPIQIAIGIVLGVALLILIWMVGSTGLLFLSALWEALRNPRPRQPKQPKPPKPPKPPQRPLRERIRISWKAKNIFEKALTVVLVGYSAVVFITLIGLILMGIFPSLIPS